MFFEEFLVNELYLINEINNKVFPLNAPEGTVAPYVIYTSSEGIEDKTLNGYLDSKIINLELDIISSKYSNMKYLARNVLTNVKRMTNKTFDNYKIEDVTYEEPIELYENEVNLYRSTINIKIKIGGI